MILQRLARVLRARRWGDAAFELFVVAIGILMAFQVDRWWELQRDRESEQDYVLRLIGDLEKDVTETADGVATAELRRDLAALLMDVADDPEHALEQPVDFIIAIDQSAYTFTPALTTNTFEELKSTGSLGLLRDDGVRDELFDYYRYDESQRQYQSLQLMQEIRHFERGAGILDNLTARSAKDRWGIVGIQELTAARQDPIDPNALQAAVERFLARDEFIAWLPIAYEMQLELAYIHAERYARANRLIELLRERYAVTADSPAD